MNCLPIYIYRFTYVHAYIVEFGSMTFHGIYSRGKVRQGNAQKSIMSTTGYKLFNLIKETLLSFAIERDHAHISHICSIRWVAEGNGREEEGREKRNETKSEPDFETESHSQSPGKKRQRRRRRRAEPTNVLDGGQSKELFAL